MISVGVSTYNGSVRLGWLLHSMSIRMPDLGEPVKVVIVDDGSPNPAMTRAVVGQYRSKLDIEYIEHGNNRGIPAGWNTATRANDARICVLVNDDVIVSEGWLESLVYCLDHTPGAGVVGCNWHAFTVADVTGLLRDRLSDRDVIPRDCESREPAPERREKYEDTDPGRVMCPGGQLFAFRRSDFDKVGGFDERIKSMFEESMFGTEMAARGLIGVQLAWPHCWHMWSETFRLNPELQSGARMEHSRNVYRQRWEIPDSVPRTKEFDYTNPKYMQAIGDVEVGFIRKSGAKWWGVLRRDGAFVHGRPERPSESRNSTTCPRCGREVRNVAVEGFAGSCDCSDEPLTRQQKFCAAYPDVHAEQQRLFPAFDYKKRAGLDLDYRNPSNVVGHQQRAFTTWWAIECCGPLDLGLDLGSHRGLTPFCIHVDRWYDNVHEHPVYGGIIPCDVIADVSKAIEVLPPRTFPCIISSHSLEHMAADGDEGVVALLVRWMNLLKPGGVLAVVVPDAAHVDVLGSDKDHRHSWSHVDFKPRVLDRLLAMTGATLVEFDNLDNHYSFNFVVRKP